MSYMCSVSLSWIAALEEASCHGVRQSCWEAHVSEVKRGSSEVTWRVGWEADPSLV